VRYVVLATEPSLTLERLAARLPEGTTTEPIGDDRLLIQSGSDIAWLSGPDGPDDDPSLLDEEDEDRPWEAAGVAVPAFFDLQFRSIAFLRRLLRRLADDPGVWVYLDDGRYRHGPDLVRRLDWEPNWTLEVPTTTGD